MKKRVLLHTRVIDLVLGKQASAVDTPLTRCYEPGSGLELPRGCARNLTKEVVASASIRDVKIERGYLTFAGENDE